MKPPIEPAKKKQSKRTAVPTISISSPDFKYVCAAATDVQKTWKKFGWVPPSKLRKEKQRESRSTVR